MANKFSSSQSFFQNISVINHENHVNIQFSVQNILLNDLDYNFNHKKNLKKQEQQLKNKKIMAVKSTKNLQCTPRATKKYHNFAQQKKKDVFIVDRKQMFKDSVEDKQTKDSYQIVKNMKNKQKQIANIKKLKGKQKNQGLVSIKMLSNKIQPSNKNRERMKSISTLKTQPKEQLLSPNGFSGRCLDSAISLKTLSRNQSAKGRSQTNHAIINDQVKIKNQKFIMNNYFDDDWESPVEQRMVKKRTSSSSKKCNLSNKLSKKQLHVAEVKDHNLKSPRHSKK